MSSNAGGMSLESYNGLWIALTLLILTGLLFYYFIYPKISSSDCPPEKVCPAEKVCPPVKVCPECPKPADGPSISPNVPVIPVVPDTPAIKPDPEASPDSPDAKPVLSQSTRLAHTAHAEQFARDMDEHVASSSSPAHYTSIADSIKHFVGDVTDKAKDAVSKVKDQVTGKIADVAVGIKDKIKDEFHGIIEHFDKKASDPTDPTKPKQPSKWHWMYGWIEDLWQKMGGVAGVLRMLRPHFKSYFIKKLHDKQLALSPPHGTGKCTLCPASLYQKCPEGEVAVGERGYNKDPAQSACNKVTELLSCERMCQKGDIFGTPVFGAYPDPTFLVNMHSIAGEVAHGALELLHGMAFIPKLKPISDRMAAKIQDYLEKSAAKKPSEFEWVVYDYADVYFNFKCPGKYDSAKKTWTDTEGKEFKYCVPLNISQKKEFSEVSKRLCDKYGSPGCNVSYGGVPTNDISGYDLKAYDKY